MTKALALDEGQHGGGTKWAESLHAGTGQTGKKRLGQTPDPLSLLPGSLQGTSGPHCGRSWQPPAWPRTQAPVSAQVLSCSDGGGGMGGWAGEAGVCVRGQVGCPGVGPCHPFLIFHTSTWASLTKTLPPQIQSPPNSSFCPLPLRCSPQL